MYMKKIISLNRWRKAQKYEHMYWMKNTENIISGSIGQLGWYEWKFNEMEKALASIYR